MAQEVSSSPNSCKFLLSQNVPIEELLGSVTTYNSVEGSETKSLQLRQSARVFKKMRLDSAIAAAATSVSADKKEVDKKEEKLDTKKPLRPLWLPEDKTLFFEALNEYGKDFEAIHTYMKLKKKGAPENAIKTREQIRHLYHRTWHKISKHLLFSEDVKKGAQELYGLINYGELRKKLVSVSPKTTIKLNELIYRGSMTLRVKGKTIRIKTPMCRALRRLNQLDEKHDDIKLPTRILIELKPKDMATWMHVQEMSQNPRVRTAVPLQKRLSSLIQCMTDRWRSQNTQDFDRMLATLKDTNTTSAADSQVDTDEYEEKRKLIHPMLHFSPPDGAPIHIPNINLSELFTSHTICMNAYERRIGVTIPGEQLWLAAFPSFKTSCKNSQKKASAAIKRQRSESGSAVTQSPPNKVPVTSTTSNVNVSSTDNNENCLPSTSESGAAVNVAVDDHLMDEYIDEAVNTILALQSSMNGEAHVSDSVIEDVVETKVKVEDDEIQQMQIQQLKLKQVQDIERIKLGWSFEDCGTLSIGDLYLMFGSDSKLELEYAFNTPNLKPKLEPLDHPTAADIPTDTNTDINKPPTAATDTPDPDDIDNNLSAVSLTRNHNDLSVTLKRLLSVAKLHYRRNIVRCPCGHVCNAAVGNSKAKQMLVQQRQRCAKAGKQQSKADCGGEGAENNAEAAVSMETSAASTSIVPVAIQPLIKRFVPNSLFRRPNSPNDCLRAQIDSIQRSNLKPRYCNRMGRRVRTKQMVVERKLPLLANVNDSGRQIVQMNIISQDNTIAIATSTTSSTPRNIAPKVHVENKDSGADIRVMYEGALAQVNAPPTSTYTSIPSVRPEITDHNGDNATTPSRVCSPTSISNLLDIALNSAQTEIDAERKSGEGSANITSFEGLISPSVSSTSGNPGTCTPPDSPSRLLKEAESQQWLNSEVADYSLSSLLGHLESPMKTAQSGSSLNGDDTRLLSQDVDAQLQSLLTETSLDYTAKFADLAAQVSDSKKERFGNT